MKAVRVWLDGELLLARHHCDSPYDVINELFGKSFDPAHPRTSRYAKVIRVDRKDDMLEFVLLDHDLARVILQQSYEAAG